MSDICRVCLAHGSFISIYRQDNNCIQISKKIMSFTRIKIDPKDGFPSAICTSCLVRTNESYQFKKDCERVDRELRQKFSHMKHTSQFNNKTKFDGIKKNSTKNFTKNCDVNIFDIDINCEGTSYVNTEFDQLESGILGKNIKGGITLDSNHTDSEVDQNKCLNLNTSGHYETDNLQISNEGKIIQNKNKRKFKIIPQKQQCVICGKVMSSWCCLKLHMRTHSGEKPYPCPYCAKRFSQANGLKIHQRTHTGERPMQCATCGRRFTQATTLAAHVRLHTGETPYACHLCSKTFRTRGHLHYHIRQHNGEKNFECETCGRGFLARCDLKQHVRTHSDDKQFMCSVCGQRLTRASNLARHMYVHDSVQPFKCTHCPAAYAQKVHLTRHLKKHVQHK